MNTHLGKQFKSNNIISNRSNKKNNHIADRSILDFGDDKFNFDDALKSVNIPIWSFTNYFKNRKDVMFKFTKREYSKLLNGTADLDNEYEFKTLEFNGSINLQKYLDIYSETIGYTITQLPIIYRFKNINNANLQFYVSSENKKIKVIFIDIYHLGILANDSETGKSSFENYEQNKNNNYCLSNLKQQYE